MVLRGTGKARQCSIDCIQREELTSSNDYWAIADILFLVCRKMTKECLAETSSGITENLMSISRMMAQQVQQSEETVTSLGIWRSQNQLSVAKFLFLLSSKYDTDQLRNCPQMFGFFFSFCWKLPRRGQSKRPMMNLKPWREPSSWGGSSLPSTTGESSLINCSFSWHSPSSLPPFYTSSKKDCSPSCRPSTTWSELSPCDQCMGPNVLCCTTNACLWFWKS